MKRNIVIASFIAGVIISGTYALAPSASALTFDDIQSQIKSLLAKVAELTTQMNTLQAQGDASAGVSTSAPSQYRICALLNRNLSQGTQGDDVRGLQEFLTTEGYLSATPTGYFGALTANAVARWQAAQGVQSVGSVGPLTRERIKVWCGGNARFSATPQAGKAPLTVTFVSAVGDSGTRPSFFDAQDTMLDFGDGTDPQWVSCNSAASNVQICPSPVKIQHTYSVNGDYVATFKKSGGRCAGPCSETVLATVKIHVGDEVGCTKEYMPVCGGKQVVCITAPCNPVPTTYGNRCMMNADGASFLYEGVCRDGSANKPPVISGFSGPTTLAVNASGTWTISASDPENGSLSYSVWWGDENVYAPSMSAGASAREFVQTTTFTHAYASAGTYTVSITVRDASGAEAKSSSTVQVGSGPVACTLQYDPVCGQPPEPACRHSIPACMIATPGPQTYGNRCQMNAAGATFLYQGQCNNYPVACTADAMQCPNGSYVGRTGPNCQFVCPN